MSTVITAHCNFCHTDLKLKPEGVGLYTFTSKHVSDFYAFFCPDCHVENRKDADSHVVSLLVSGGVLLKVVDVPLEVVERMSCKTPLNLDDVLNLTMYLRDHDYLPGSLPARRLLRGASRPQGAP